jgi:hypothetical protein
MGLSFRMATVPALIKVSFSLYPADMTALNFQVAELRKAGFKVRRATLLRALIHHATPLQMFSYAAVLAEAYRQKDGPREESYIADYPTVDLPKADVEKLEDAVTELARRGLSANRTFVARALLRGLPRDADITAVVRQFQRECPDRPRGWAARKLKASRG